MSISPFFTRMAGDDDIKEADEYWQSTLAVLNNSIYSENNVLKSMRDWHVASKSILPSSSEKGHKVFKLHKKLKYIKENILKEMRKRFDYVNT